MRWKGLMKGVIYVDPKEWEAFKKVCHPLSRSKVIAAYIHMCIHGKNITLDDALAEIMQRVVTPKAIENARRVLQEKMK